MRSNMLTLLGVIVVLVFLMLLTSWKWAGLAAGLVLIAAGRAALAGDGDGS